MFVACENALLIENLFEFSFRVSLMFNNRILKKISLLKYLFFINVGFKILLLLLCVYIPFYALF